MKSKQNVSSKWLKFEISQETPLQIPETPTDAELLSLIEAEMRGNLHILLDPKKKDSFNQQRVSAWTRCVSERVLHYVKLWMPQPENK